MPVNTIQRPKHSEYPIDCKCPIVGEVWPQWLNIGVFNLNTPNPSTTNADHPETSMNCYIVLFGFIRINRPSSHGYIVMLIKSLHCKTNVDHD